MGEQAAARAAAAAAAVLQVQLHVCCSACFGLSDFAARITVKFSLRGFLFKSLVLATLLFRWYSSQYYNRVLHLRPAVVPLSASTSSSERTLRSCSSESLTSGTGGISC